MKFCCEKFELHYSFRNGLAHSFRVINCEPITLSRENTTNHMRFIIITSPYVNFNILETPSIMIDYCPFCGTDLHRYYKTEEYINETLLR